MLEIIFLVEEDLSEGFTAKALSESIYTQGQTLEELRANVKDAVACHFEEQENKPSLIRLHFVRDEVIAA
jgi:hypothetical protein